MYQYWYYIDMPLNRPIPVVFFSLDSGREPVRDWLKDLDKESKRAIGEDIKTLQFGWPIGMPLARKMDDNLWELRSKLGKGIARTFFTVYRNKLVLLHGFVKKSQKTPPKELSLAKRRLNKLRSDQ
jgi:phage-related protein